jgi:ketosteroid isomerase-like protein
MLFWVLSEDDEMGSTKISRWQKIALIMAVVTVITLASCGVASAEDKMDEVELVAASFIDAFNDLDWERFRQFFAEDATVFFPFADTPRRVSGKMEIEARFEKFFNEARRGNDGPPYLSIEPSGTHVQHLGDTAIVTFHLRSEPVLNRRTVVFQRRSEQWIIVHLHASVMASSTEE